NKLTGNMETEANVALQASIKDALALLQNYHKTASNGAAEALADAPGTIYDALKTAFGVSAAAADDLTFIPASATTRAKKVAASLAKLDALFSMINDAIESIKSAVATALKTADDTLYMLSPSYKSVVDGVAARLNWLPPSGAVAGIYAATDRD